MTVRAAIRPANPTITILSRLESLYATPMSTSPIDKAVIFPSIPRQVENCIRAAACPAGAGMMSVFPDLPVLLLQRVH